MSSSTLGNKIREMICDKFYFYAIHFLIHYLWERKLKLTNNNR